MKKLLQPHMENKKEKADDAALRGIITSRKDRVILWILLGLLALCFLFPMFAAIVKSFEINGLGNYWALFTEPIGSVPIWLTYVNSLAIGALHAIIVVSIATLAGFAFSKLVFAGRDVYFSLVLFFLAVPAVALIVPVYRVTQEVGMFNTYLGVALPEAALTLPFGVLLMRNAGKNVPNSLMEAARLDGAANGRVFFSVFLPLARPSVVNLTILCFVWSMQDFLWPSFIFTDPNKATAAQAVQTFSNSLGRGVADLAKYNASLVLLAVPAVFFVVFGLRFIVNGMSSGAVKE